MGRLPVSHVSQVAIVDPPQLNVRNAGLEVTSRMITLRLVILARMVLLLAKKVQPNVKSVIKAPMLPTRASYHVIYALPELCRTRLAPLIVIYALMAITKMKPVRYRARSVFLEVTVATREQQNVHYAHQEVTPKDIYVNLVNFVTKEALRVKLERHHVSTVFLGHTQTRRDR